VGRPRSGPDVQKDARSALSDLAGSRLRALQVNLIDGYYSVFLICAGVAWDSRGQRDALAVALFLGENGSLRLENGLFRLGTLARSLLKTHSSDSQSAVLDSRAGCERRVSPPYPRHRRGFFCLDRTLWLSVLAFRFVTGLWARSDAFSHAQRSESCSTSNPELCQLAFMKLTLS
jgi:hypothetical protein